MNYTSFSKFRTMAKPRKKKALKDSLKEAIKLSVQPPSQAITPPEQSQKKTGKKK